MKLLFIECKRVGGSVHTICHLSFDIADDGDGGARGGWDPCTSQRKTPICLDQVLLCNSSICEHEW